MCVCLCQNIVKEEGKGPVRQEEREAEIAWAGVPIGANHNRLLQENHLYFSGLFYCLYSYTPHDSLSLSVPPFPHSLPLPLFLEKRCFPAKITLARILLTGAA